MKKQRYVFLKNPENLTAKQVQSLDYPTKLNLQTAKAYQMHYVWRSRKSTDRKDLFGPDAGSRNGPPRLCVRHEATIYWHL